MRVMFYITVISKHFTLSSTYIKIIIEKVDLKCPHNNENNNDKRNDEEKRKTPMINNKHNNVISIFRRRCTNTHKISITIVNSKKIYAEIQINSRNENGAVILFIIFMFFSCASC